LTVKIDTYLPSTIGKVLLKDYETLDIKYEFGHLLLGEKARMDTIVVELESFWNMEEIKKAKQQSRERNIKGGDRNISYFQDIANQRTGTK
jgi:phosphomevalonate kinase